MKACSVVYGCVLVCLLAVSACSSSPPRRPTSELVKAAVAKSRPAVAIVFPDVSRGGLVGSGVFITPEGLMLTNDHVVELSKPGSMAVVASNGRAYRAKIVGRDAVQDIALVQVIASSPQEVFPYIEMGDSDAIGIGDWVMAIGNPLGIGSRDRQVTVTLGILAAKHRVLAPLGSEKFARYTDGLQAELATHPGNSGGALVDMNGKLVGINGAGGDAGMAGFAIPVNQIRRYLPRLKRGEEIVHAELNVAGRRLNAAESGKLGRGGFRVTRPPAFDPEMSVDYLKPRDIILAIDGEPVYSGTDLLRIVDRREPGDAVDITVLRGDATVVERGTLTKMKVDLVLIKKTRDAGKIHSEAIGLLQQRKLAEALKKFREVLDILPNLSSAHYNIACCYSLMKDADKAFEAMTRAFELGVDNAAQLRTDPDLEFIRSDPRFDEFYKKMKLLED